MNPPDRRIYAVLALCLLLMLGASYVAWRQLPADARIPTHWGVNGLPDQYSSKAFGLLLMPVIAAVLVPTLLFVLRFDPRKTHVAQSRQPIALIVVAVLVFLTGIHLAMVAISLGQAISMNAVVLNGVGGLFMVLGYAMRALHSNFLVGIRTPWTLSSERSWHKTHQLGSVLFIASGALTIVLGWTAPVGAAVLGLLVSTVGSVAVLFAYSYLVWRDDPDRSSAPQKVA